MLAIESNPQGHPRDLPKKTEPYLVMGYIHRVFGGNERNNSHNPSHYHGIIRSKMRDSVSKRNNE